MAQTGLITDFRKALEEEDWVKAVEVGKDLADELDADPWMGPKVHAGLHRDLGVAYMKIGQGDVYVDNSDPMCGIECTHSSDHLHEAERIAKRHGLAEIAASARDVIDGPQDSLAPYLGILSLVTEPEHSHSV